jgi:hypothetical protein
MLHDLQVWLVTNIIAHSPVAHMMRTAWGWPIAESIHFLGLCLLIGCIGTFDLRLLGVAKRVPIAAMHRLIPWGILGFVINASSGLMFLLTEPDQYIYNPSFHFKFLFIAIAGLNAGTFYLSSYRQIFGANPVARRAAAREAHCRDLTERLGPGHHLWAHAHLLPSGVVHRSADLAPADVRACSGETNVALILNFKSVRRPATVGNIPTGPERTGPTPGRR